MHYTAFMFFRCIAIFVVAAAPVGAQTMCEQVRALTEDPTVAAAHWGVAVASLDGTVLCGVDEGKLFRPASNDKIFTTATALALLGADKTVETKVTGKLDAATGVVSGDLKLVGGGDGNLDSGDLPYVPASQRPKTPVPFAFHDLEELAAQLVAKGVKTVSGDIVGDDTYFPYEPYPPSWNGDDFVWGYGAPVSALTIADNQMRLTVTPGGRAATPASVELEENGVDYYTVQAEVMTIPAKQAGGVQVERLPGSRRIRVYGSITTDAPPDVEQVAISDPALYAALAFRNILLAHGIAVKGAAVARHRPEREGRGFTAQLLAQGGQEQAVVSGGTLGGSCPGVAWDSNVSNPMLTLATHVSAALAEDVKLTNKVSQNLHAELMLHRLGYAGFCGSGSNVAGARMVRAELLRAGVQPNDFMLLDGSGLSDHDLVAPRAIVKFLGFAATQPWFAEFKASLPDSGVGGSLGARFKGLQAGTVWAKTGTLGESRALSGYVTTVGGKTLVFSVMVDNHLPGTTADRVVMDKIVETIAGGN